MSAKAGIGIDDLLKAIVNQFPAPKADRTAPLQAMVFDSHYDEYLFAATVLTGVLQIIAGWIRLGELMRFVSRSVVTGPLSLAAAARR